jgi:NADH-ubiquinone oxidoreductase chain 1
LVSGFFTEHSSIIFVFFFLAEYCSIVLMSALTAILFFGGYLMPEFVINDSVINFQSIILALKTCLFCFTFVWFRATLPRLRFDQLISLCWTGFLPVVLALIVLVFSLPVAFDLLPFAVGRCSGVVEGITRTPLETDTDQNKDWIYELILHNWEIDLVLMT